MTQIISLLTQDYVMVAADCQLSKWNGSHYEIDDDKAAKLISLDGRSFVAYSGCAKLGGEPTPHWVARAIRRTLDGTVEGALRNIQSRCVASMPNGYREKQQHFMAVGFGTFNQEDALRPYCILISNVIDQDGRRIFRGRGPMTLRAMVLPVNSIASLQVGGFQLSTYRYRRLAFALKSMIKKRECPRIVMRRLVQEIRFTSLGRRNKFVGPRVLSAFIPKCAEQTRKVAGFFNIVAKEPAWNDRWSSFAIYDRWGRYAHDEVGLVIANKESIVEIQETQMDQAESSGSIRTKYIQAPSPGSLSPFHTWTSPSQDQVLIVGTRSN